MTGASLKGTKKILREAAWYKGLRKVPIYARAKHPEGKCSRVEIHLTCGHVLNLPLNRIRGKKFNCAECVSARDRKITH